MSERISDEEFQAAREALQRRVRGVLLQAYGYLHAQGMTTAKLADRISCSERWVRGMLFGPYKLTLRAMSDLAVGMGVEFTFSTVPKEAKDESESDPRLDPPTEGEQGERTDA